MVFSLVNDEPNLCPGAPRARCDVLSVLDVVDLPSPFFIYV